MNVGVRDCGRFEELLELYVDGELADLERGEFEAHSARCATCSDQLARAQRMKRDLRSTADAFRLSPTFHARFQVAMEATPSPAMPPASTPKTQVAPRLSGGWAAAAAVAFLGIPAAFFAARALPAGDADGPPASGWVAGASSEDASVIQQSVRWHRRQVPVEVTGPSPLFVQNWFASKVEFPVHVPDFGRAANLLGGRLGNVDESAAAVLIYEVDGRKMSVLAFDAEAVLGPAAYATPDTLHEDSSGGYAVVHYRRGPVGYSFTSDMDRESLRSLAEASFVAHTE